MYRRRPRYQRYRGGPRPAGKMRLMAALAVAIISLVSYFGSKSYNPVTGENQYVGITPRQEIALGLQAAPQMIQQYGGLYADDEWQARIDAIGHKIVVESDAGQTEWKFDFHLLNDAKTVNAFALPGGQIFITSALVSRLTTEGQIAGVLGHEVGHVVARHSAQQMAKSKLTQGLTGAVIVASEDGRQTAQLALVVGQLVNMKYGRDDELESDYLGVRFMSEAGYDPRSMIDVMKVLAEAGGGARQPEFFSTHPNPENRVARIQAAIDAYFPDGVPDHLSR